MPSVEQLGQRIPDIWIGQPGSHVKLHTESTLRFRIHDL